jgi:hypothetical protein
MPWAPLSVAEVVERFAGAPFVWGLAGGYAIEQFVGRPLRAHSDIDIVVFREDQLALQGWLRGWRLFAADPPGALRPWSPGEMLPYGVHDIWCLMEGASAWQLQVMLMEAEGDVWFSRRDRRVRGPRSELIVPCGGLPCLRVEVQLFYKARGLRPKDQQDFDACLGLLDGIARRWLAECLRLVHGQEHPWLAPLLADRPHQRCSLE